MRRSLLFFYEDPVGELYRDAVRKAVWRTRSAPGPSYNT